MTFRRGFLALLAVATLAAGGWIVVRSSEARVDAGFRARLLDQVIAISRAINPSRIEVLAYTEADLKSPEFLRLRSQFSSFAAAIRSRGIYTLALRDGALVFGPESYPEEDPMASPPGTVYRRPAPEFFRAFEAGVPFVIGPVRDEYGEFIIAGAPVLDEKGETIPMVVGVDVEAAAWRAALREERRRALVSLGPPALILGLGFAFFAWRRKQSPVVRTRLHSAEVWFVAFLGFSLTWLAAHHMRAEDQHTRRHAFGYLGRLQTERVGVQVRHLRDHMLGQVVRFFEGSDHVDPEEFRVFTASQVRQPGVEVMGWAVPVPAGEADAWEAAMRREGPADLRLRPKPDGSQPLLYPVRYLEPVDTCNKALGFDLGSIPLLREALELSSETGLPTAVYLADVAPDLFNGGEWLILHPRMSLKGRRAEGFALSVLRMEPLLQGLLEIGAADVPNVVICLHLIEPDAAPGFLASSHPAEHVRHAGEESGMDNAFLAHYDGMGTLHPLFVFGQPFVLAAHPGPAFLAALPGWAERFALVIGGLLTVLATALTFFILHRRDVLETQVAERTANLLATIRSIGDAVISTDRKGRIRQMNPVAEQLTGWPESEARGNPLDTVFRIINEQTRESADDPVQRVLRDRQIVQLANHTVLIARDGTERPIADSAAPIVNPQGTLLGVVLVFRDQTRERESRRKLEESEAFTRNILDHLPIGVSVNSVDSAVTFMYMNEEFTKIYRTSREALSRPDSFWETVYPDPAFRKQLRQRVLEDSASGDPARMQWNDIPLVRADRDTVYISARNIPIPGRPLVISTVWDVTDRVRHEQERRGTIEFLQRLVRPSDLDALVREASAWLRDWTRCETVRIRLDADRDAGDTEPDDPLDPAAHTEIPLEASGARLGHIQFRGSHPFRFSARDSARLARWAQSLALAVKQRLDAEALRNSQRLLTMAGRVARLGGWRVDLKSNRLSWSDEVAAIHGKPPGSSPTVEEGLSLFAPECRDRIRAAYIACATKGTPYAEEAQIITADGKRVWVLAMGEAERDAGGAIVGVAGAFQDISARMELEQQVRQAQKMESVGRLTGGIAHDFNNMLQTILGNVELLLLSEDIPSSRRVMIEDIQAAAQQSAGLTRQLLAFSRKQTIQPRVLNLNEAVEHLLKLLRRLLGEDIDLRWKPASECGSVFMDPSQLSQILTNLAVNARDAIAGVGRMTVETECVTLDEAYGRRYAEFIPGSYVLLGVSDDGQGMPPEIIPKIFEPFFTTKEKGKGTGLGLATVFGIVRQNKGFIHVYSEVDQGTTFRIYLPRHAGADSPDPEPHPGNKGSRPEKEGHETVLLVEDEKGILVLAKKMLEPLGYTILAANGPEEALKMAAAHPAPIDVLLTDVVMPGMSGRDLWQVLVERRPGLRCLFMSGYTANVIAHRGVLDPGMHFLQKPFSQPDLAAALRRALES